jgi:hypothetical protein
MQTLLMSALCFMHGCHLQVLTGICSLTGTLNFVKSTMMCNVSTECCQLIRCWLALLPLPTLCHQLMHHTSSYALVVGCSRCWRQPRYQVRYHRLHHLPGQVVRVQLDDLQNTSGGGVNSYARSTTILMQWAQRLAVQTYTLGRSWQTLVQSPNKHGWRGHLNVYAATDNQLILQEHELHVRLETFTTVTAATQQSRPQRPSCIGCVAAL